MTSLSILYFKHSLNDKLALFANSHCLETQLGRSQLSLRKVSKLLRDNQEKLDPSEASGLAVST